MGIRWILAYFSNTTTYIITHLHCFVKHNGKPLHDRERLVRQSLKNISRASLDVSGCPSLGIFWVFGGLWGSLGVFGDLWGFDLLKVRLFSSHARCDFLVFSCKVHKTFWFLIQDEIWVFLSYMRLLGFHILHETFGFSYPT